MGRVVVLTGSSSAGKTSIGRKLQESLEEDWMLLGVDVLLWMMPNELMRNPEGVAADHGVITRGPRFMRLFAAFRNAVAALAHSGVDVLVDDVMQEAAIDQAMWEESLEGLNVTWIGIRCDPDIVAAREAARGDRPRGVARQQAMTVHEGVRYDFEVDTGVLSTAEATDAIVAFLQEKGHPAGDEPPTLPVRSAWTSDGRVARAPWESS